MCKLSIVVPVYNVQDYLEECLNSILAQHYADYEVICVDDGSTDNSPLILEDYAQKDTRIRIIHKENGGLVSARKAGIEAARGTYATYVDSDDWIAPDMYETMMKVVMETGADIVTSGVIIEYPSGSVVELEEMETGLYRGTGLNERFYPQMIDTQAFFVQNVSMHLVQKVFRTDLLKRNQLQVPEEVEVCEDAACTYPCFLEAESVFVMNSAFYHYRIRENSIMGNCEKAIDSYKSLYFYLQKRFEKYPYPYLTRQLEWLIMFALLMIKPSVVWTEDSLIPYADLKRGDKVVLYGMGRFGKAFSREIENAKLCKVTSLIDANRKIDSRGRRCYTLEEFIHSETEYDYILITILKRNLYREVKAKMIESGIAKEKILEPTIGAKTGVLEKIFAR